MKRIIIHWTAGAYTANEHEKTCYHYLIEADGTVVKGKYEPEANENCYDGVYAAHTGGGNTGSIGVALCGMFVPKNTPLKITKYPLTKIQCERAFKLCAELCKKYNIQVTPQTVLTHYEFGLKHPNTSSAGKIDITSLPPYDNMTPAEVGGFIRNKIRWYLARI